MIALFGSNGYLGSQLKYFFTKRGEKVEGFDLPQSDILDVSFWDNFCPSKYTAILFFSGLTGTERGFADAVKYTEVNEIGLLHLLMRIAPLGKDAPRIVFPSSRLVYQGSEQTLPESALTEPKTVYAVNKLACESLLAAYSNRFGLPYNVARICVPYGNLISTEYSYGTIGFFLRQIRERGAIALYGGGEYMRTFTHVEDVCMAVSVLLEGNRNGIYNIGGTALSLREAATLIAEKYSAEVLSVAWPGDALKIESGSTVFDAGAMSRDFSWSPTHNFEVDIRQMW